MKPIPIRHLRFLTALLSTLLLLAGPVFAFSSLTADPAAAAPAAEASITLDEVTPWVDEEGTLTVRGIVANPTDKPIEKPSLSLQMSTRKLNSETRMSSWKQGRAEHRTVADLDHDRPQARKKAKKDKSAEADAASGITLDTPIEDTIDPGTSAEFTFTVPADELGLSRSSPVSSWGPRGLAVQLGDDTGLRASAIGFTTWYPTPKFDQTKVSVLAPVTLPGYSEGGIISAAELDRAIADGGSLDTVKKLLGHKELALAVDPRIITSFKAAIAQPPPADGKDPDQTEDSGDDAQSPSPPPGVAEKEDEDAGAAELKAEADRRKRLDDWYTDFVAAAQKHTIFALPFGDPDLSALRGTAVDHLGSFAQKQREVVKDVFPDAHTDIAWPVAGSATKNSLRALKKSGNSTALLSNTQQPSSTGIHDDAHSQTTITDDGQHTIDTLITDSKLSDMAAQAIGSDHLASALSELVAESATIQSEAPYRTRSLLVTLPRTAASEGWEQTVEALTSAPWVGPTGVDELLAAPTASRGLLRTDSDAPHIRTEAVKSLAETRANQAGFNSVFTDREGADMRLDRELLSCTSAAWTLSAKRNGCADKARAQSRKLMDSLHLRKGSSVLLVTGVKTTIPVTIVNDSPAEASLRIRMKSSTPQLRTEETETVKVPAAETMRVDVPVEGLANADVPTHIEMVTADGDVLPQEEALLVRVRADWENIGTAIVGFALAVVFVIGLVKTISRGRPKIPEQQLADAMARARTDENEKR